MSGAGAEAGTAAEGFVFDRSVAAQIVRYGRMVVARGYIHNTLGNIAIRVPCPGHPHGVAYTKPSRMSLEEVEVDDIVVTDIPTGRLIHGTLPTNVGHHLNREMFRLRDDINAVIHIHHDETLAWMASRRDHQIETLSLEYPYVMAKPPYFVPAHLDVEQDVGPLKEFIHRTNAVVMLRHGMTTLGRDVSEAYHRLNTLTSEIRRNILVEQLCRLRGTTPDLISAQDIEWMYGQAEKVIYPHTS